MQGPNDRVEHREVGTAVVRALSELGVHVSKVFAFVSHSALVLQQAFDVVLKLLCSNARWVPCFSHALNNVAKEVMKSLNAELVALFEIRQVCCMQSRMHRSGGDGLHIFELNKYRGCCP